MKNIKCNCLPGGTEIRGYNISLRPIQVAHLEKLRQWRNSVTIREQMLNTEEISAAQHRQWYKEVLRDVTQKHWAVFYGEKLIGATNIKSCNGLDDCDRAARLVPGLYIGEPRYRGSVLAFAPTLALYDYCFQSLSTEVLIAIVRDGNSAAISYNRALGYVPAPSPSGAQCEDYIHLYLTAERYERATKKIKYILNRQRVA